MRADCSNQNRFDRRAIEDVVLGAFETLLLTPDAIRYIEAMAIKLLAAHQQAATPAHDGTPSEVSKLDAEIEELRSLLKMGRIRPEVLHPALRAAEERRLALLKKVDGAKVPSGRPMEIAISRAAQDIRRIVIRLRHTASPTLAHEVRQALRKFIPGGAIELRLDAYTGRFNGVLEIDASAYLPANPGASHCLHSPVSVPASPCAQLSLDSKCLNAGHSSSPREFA